MYKICYPVICNQIQHVKEIYLKSFVDTYNNLNKKQIDASVKERPQTQFVPSEENL